MTTSRLRPWDAPEITSWRRLPMHALAHRGDEVGVQRLDLDGPWGFELFPTPEQALAADAPPRARLVVPGCWTMQRFDDVNGIGDRPQYTHGQMPWPDLPPHPPRANPTGVYEREVQIPAGWVGHRVVLHVGAAESVLIVQVDGVDVGVSKDSHLAAEFDLTHVVRPGRRCRLRLIVVKWSDASFLEDADQWWHGGITRSVFLYSTGPVHLGDVHARAELGADGRTGSVSVQVEVASAGSGWSVRARLAGSDVALQAPVPPPGPVGAGGPDGVAPGRSTPWMQAALEQVRPWSPEDPHCYRLEVTLHGPDGQVVESTWLQVGFRSVRIVGNDLYVNGIRFFIRGVNRHDFDPLGGRVVSAASIRQDLLAIKRFGFNAVRTAHYPNDPVLLDVADELGLFVLDEADLDCHAFADQLADDPGYLAAFVDRVSRMVRRDKNHPSVLAWSLGNESGYGAGHDAAAGWVRRYDPTRPLHHDGAITSDWSAAQTASDLTCPRYPSIEAIVGHARSGRQRHPLIMCEYSHAMGNSNGALADYWRAIESTPGLQGGFVGQFWDHGLLQRTADGLPAGDDAAGVPSPGPGLAPAGYRWAHGGDFGDRPNDGGFAADGLVFPDRSAKPAMWEHRQLAAPVRISPGARWGEVVFENRQQVRDLSWLRGQWQLLADGEVRRPALIRSMPAYLPALPPGGRAAVQLPPELLADLAQGSAAPGKAGEVWLTLHLISATDEPWAPAGTPLPSSQLLVRPETRALPVRAGAVAAEASPPPVEVDGDGLLTHPALAVPPRLCLWRAPTDNDRVGGAAARWRALGVDRLSRTLVAVERDGARALVRAHYRTGAGVVIEHTQVLTPFPVEGGRVGVLVEETAVLPPELVDLPRVGTVFEVPAELGWVDWYGTGPWETYPDRRACGEVGGYGSQVRSWFTPYLRPQESGGRAGVRWLSLSVDSAGERGLAIHLDQPRQVSLAHYRAEDLDAAAHHDELVARPQIVVHLDAAHRGLGTASRGPDTLPAYRLAAGRYEWSWTLTPRGDRPPS